jgi:integrase
MKLCDIKFHENTVAPPTKTKTTYVNAVYATAAPQTLYLRDGELVLYRRTRSLLYQYRYKLADGTWFRQSTRKAAIENAITVACDLYDEARYRQRLGLAHRSHSFAHIAEITLADMRQQLDLGVGKRVYHTYVTCIEKYFVPYFKDKRFEEITHSDVVEFEIWRNRQMVKVPKSSTLQNFASAWSKLINVAVARGFISERVPVPKLSTKGEKGKTRPAFTEDEINTLLTFMQTWQHEGKREAEKEIRPLLRDYIEMLLLTGMRHGTEAMGIFWKHIEWHTDKGIRYLRIWVDGKTGGRWLIAKHRAVDVLKRIHARQTDVKSIDFENLLTERVQHKLFTFSDGYQPPSMNGTFRRLMRDTGLLLDSEGKTRALYSIRHTYATQEMLAGNVDIHTLSKQMGNSAAMIEKHYSKLTATMAAEKLA